MGALLQRSLLARGGAFAHLALTHSDAHFGEATVVRGLLGSPDV